MLFESRGAILNPPRFRDLFLVTINYKDGHKTFVFFKLRLHERFPNVDIANLFRRLACEDFTSWDPRVFKSSISRLRAGHLDHLLSDDDAAKQQVKDYLHLHRIVSHLQLLTVQNHIVDVIKARQTCHQGWFDASLVKYVYDVTRDGDGLRRFLVDCFVYKAYRQTRYEPTAKTYWSTRRRSVLAENVCMGNLEFVMDQADAAAAEKIIDPYTRGTCYYHNHDPGFKCHLATHRGLKRKRQDSEDD